MALASYLSIEEFYLLFEDAEGVVKNAFVQKVIDKTNLMLVQKLGRLFALSDDTKRYRARPSKRLIMIDTWQSGGGNVLTIKKGSDDSSTLRTLTEGSDYRLIRWEDVTTAGEYPNAVIGVRLYDQLNSDRDFIEVSGKLGLSADVPDDLFLAERLYDIILTAAYATQTKIDTEGQGQIIRAEIDKVRTEFANKAETTDPRLQSLAGTLEYIKEQLEQIVVYYKPELLVADAIG